MLASNWDKVRDEVKKQRWGFIQGVTLCPLGLDGDKSKYLQNFNVETVRNILLGRQARKLKRYALFWEITLAYSGSSLPTFRRNISVPTSGFSTR